MVLIAVSLHNSLQNFENVTPEEKGPSLYSLESVCFSYNGKNGYSLEVKNSVVIYLNSSDYEKEKHLNASGSCSITLVPLQSYR